MCVHTYICVCVCVCVCVLIALFAHLQVKSKLVGQRLDSGTCCFIPVETEYACASLVCLPAQQVTKVDDYVPVLSKYLVKWEVET